MPHLHYDRDPGRSPLQHSWETSPLQWCLGAHSQATGHIYIMEHLPYRLGRIFTPSHHECHQLRCVSAVMLCVGSGANRRDTPSFDPFEYPSPPGFCVFYSAVPPRQIVSRSCNLEDPQHRTAREYFGCFFW